MLLYYHLHFYFLKFIVNIDNIYIYIKYLVIDDILINKNMLLQIYFLLIK